MPSADRDVPRRPASSTTSATSATPGPGWAAGTSSGALYVHGLRTAFGLGRSAKAKIFPWLVVGIVAAGRRGRGRDPQPRPARSVADVRCSSPTRWLARSSSSCAVVAPELVSRDLRSGVLPLYFSRPLAAATTRWPSWPRWSPRCGCCSAGPLLLMFLGAAFTTERACRGVWNEFARLPARAALRRRCARWSSPRSALLVASLTGKRAFAAGGDRGGVPDDHADRRGAGGSLPSRDRQRAGRPRLPVHAGQRGGHLVAG